VFGYVGGRYELGRQVGTSHRDDKDRAWPWDWIEYAFHPAKYLTLHGSTAHQSFRPTSSSLHYTPHQYSDTRPSSTQYSLDSPALSFMASQPTVTAAPPIGPTLTKDEKKKGLKTTGIAVRILAFILVAGLVAAPILVRKDRSRPTTCRTMTAEGTVITYKCPKPNIKEREVVTYDSSRRHPPPIHVVVTSTRIHVQDGVQR
jgi:hypothetical protein